MSMTMPLSAALLIASRPLWEQTNACIQNLPVRIVLESNEIGEIDEMLDRIERHHADVVLVEMSQLNLPLEEFVRRLRELPSQPAVFVLHNEASPHHILEALRGGVNEFLFPPLAETLHDAFERLSAVRSKSAGSAAGGLGRVFGFLSVKGGCGATTFVSHVAPAVAAKLGTSTLLADFDFDAGMLRFIMKSRATWSVRDALDNMHRMDSNYWKKLVSTHENRLDLIPSPDDLAARRPAGPQETTHLLRFMRSTYPATLIDFGRHVSLAALDALPEVDTLYLVTTVDLDTLEHARDCLQAVGQRGFSLSRVRLLVNKVSERGGVDPKGVESFLGIRCSGVFTTDHGSLYDAWSEGRLLDSGTKLGREFQLLAGSIVARVRGEADVPLTKPSPGQSPFDRLLSQLAPFSKLSKFSMFSRPQNGVAK